MNVSLTSERHPDWIRRNIQEQYVGHWMFLQVKLVVYAAMILLLHPNRCTLCTMALLMSIALTNVSLHRAVFNVRSFGAVGDGRINDAPAIQAAEEAAERAGGGQVYLPASRYWVEDTILIGSNIDFYGDGNRTILIRSDHPTMVRLYGADCAAPHPPTGAMRLLLTNRHYNCVDRGIHLHDFEVDGSQITSVPLSCLLCFSGLENSVLEHITVLNAPQDAMFFRNGGVNLLVQGNTILMHNRLWGNGDGINIEMHKEGHLWGAVTIRDNTIVTAASNFCTAALNHACATDSDCAALTPATCGKGGSSMAAIGVSWVDGPHAPSLTIAGNHLWVGNHHYGIICNGCSNSTITGNTILAASLRDPAASGDFFGISSYATPAGEPQNLTITGNIIEGDGSPGDGPAILVNGHGTQNSKVVMRRNVVANKRTSPAHSAIEIRGWRDVVIAGNTVCSASPNSIRVGAPGVPTAHVTQSGNKIIRTGGTLPAECSGLPR